MNSVRTTESRPLIVVAAIIAAAVFIPIALLWSGAVRLPASFRSEHSTEDLVSLASEAVLRKIAAARWQCESIKTPAQVGWAIDEIMEAARLALDQAALIAADGPNAPSRGSGISQLLKAINAELNLLNASVEAAKKLAPQHGEALDNAAREVEKAVTTFIGAAGPPDGA